MVPWLLLGGLVLAPSAAFLLWSWRGQHRDMALMRTTETTPAADVAKLPPGSLVEVKGRLRCAQPVTGDLSNSPCAHFAATIERDYEIAQHDAGRKTTYHVRKTEIVQSTTLFAPFEIEDASGRAKVVPADAIIEGIEAVDRRDVAGDEDGESVMQTALGGGNGGRTLGFRYKEMHLPLDVDVYVLGVVSENCCIGAPPKGAKGQRFLISVKSEETRAAELGSVSTWMLGLGAACLLGAAISLGSALWLTRERLGEVAPPQEVLQGDRFW
jgi:E3 ubiquitin ligase